MLNFDKTIQLLYIAGCQLPDHFDESDAAKCSSAIDELSGDIEHIISKLKKEIHAADLENFLYLSRNLKETLHNCFLSVLEADCDFLIDHMQRGKYVISEALMERFASNLIGMSVAYQSNLYRMQKMGTSLETETSKSVNKIQPVSRDQAPIVLAVDDSPEILTILKTIFGARLRFYGMASGTMALKFLEKQKPDLYLFDIDMPGMNGFELAEKAKVKESGKPLFFLTSNANRENLIKALHVGANDFIVKPCDEKVILEKVETALGIKL